MNDSSTLYPSHGIRMIVPFPHGGPSDLIARLLATHLTDSLGQQVIIENRAGLNGLVGTNIAAKAEPDGYTVLMATSAHAINPSIYRHLPFDWQKDFTPVSLVASVCNVLLIHPSVPAQSFDQFVAFARAHPGRLKYSSTGDYGPPHLAGELFKKRAGVDIVHVPYPSHGAADAALVSGEVQVMFDAVAPSMPEVRAGHFRALAVTTMKRIPAARELPTLDECGLSGYEINPAMGLLAPAGTPAAIIAQLSAATAQVMHAPKVKSHLQDTGMEAVGSTPEQYSVHLKAVFDKWVKVIRDCGMPMLESPPGL